MAVPDCVQSLCQPELSSLMRLLAISASPPPKNWGLLAIPPTVAAVPLLTPSWVRGRGLNVCVDRGCGLVTQLGVDDQRAVMDGRLINKPIFFGSALAETLSAATGNAGWGNDRSTSVRSTHPWFMRGGHANLGGNAGIHAHGWADAVGGVQASVSHRTILLGY